MGVREDASVKRAKGATAVGHTGLDGPWTLESLRLGHRRLRLNHHAHHHRHRNGLSAPSRRASGAGPAPGAAAPLPLLFVDHHRHDHPGMGGRASQAPRQHRNRRRPPQSAEAGLGGDLLERHGGLPAATADRASIERYGVGCPDDWMERNLYSRFPTTGVLILAAIDILLFGFIGLTVWAVQMLWIPVLAAGVINGVGHFWGYRNYESPDASTNMLPWGIRHRRRGTAQQPSRLPQFRKALAKVVGV